MTGSKRALGSQLLVLMLISGCIIVEAPTTEVMGPSTVVLTPASTRMVFLGQTKQFQARVRDALGVFSRPPVAWSSSDASVFTVDDGGLVTAVGDGTAELRATAAGTTAIAPVTVAQTVANILILSGTDQRGVAGSTLDDPIVVRVTDEGGTAMAGQTINFTPGGNGSVSSASVQTDARGEASTSWTLGDDRLGQQLLGITVGRVQNGVAAFAFPATPIPDLSLEGGLRLGLEEPTDLETVEITIDVANTGNAATPGAFGLAISVDGVAVETFEVGQLQVDERVELTYSLGPLDVGEHRLAVLLDPGDEVAEWFEDNNRAARELSVVRQRVIEPGQSVTVSSNTVDEVILFRVDIAEGVQEALNVRLSGGVGDADLFVQYGDRPGTQYDYECLSGEPATLESCQMVPVRAGSYHIAVHAFSAFGPTTLSVAIGGRPIEPFDIEVDFASSVSPSRRDVIREAVKRWESVIARGAAEVNLGSTIFRGDNCVAGGPTVTGRIDDLVVLVSIDEIDGEGGVVATGQPCLVRSTRFSRASSTTFQETAIGGILLDASDVAGLEEDGMLSAVVSHNTAHVLGFGYLDQQLWDVHDLIVDPVESDAFETDPHFTGPLAIAAFNAAGGTGYAGSRVPVENTGGPGFANDHWRESVFGEELMTAILTSTSPPLSLITIESLADMGYGVDLTRADDYTLPAGTAALATSTGPVVRLHDDPRRNPIMAIDRQGRVFQIGTRRDR